MAFSCIVNKIDSSFQLTQLQTIEVIKKSIKLKWPMPHKAEKNFISCFIFLKLYIIFVYDIDNVSTNFHNEVLKIVEAMKRIAR